MPASRIFAACTHAGFFVDALFLNLGAEKNCAARPPRPGGTRTQADVNIGLYELAGFYRLGGQAHGLDLLVGARMSDYRTRIEGKNLIDAFGGVRYLTAIGKRWDFVVRGDVGTGGTDLTWNAVGSFGVRLGKTDRYDLRFGWRHMVMDVTAKNSQNIEIESNQTLTGPFFGFAMKF